jgi:hypothetical protein
VEDAVGLVEDGFGDSAGSVNVKFHAEAGQAFDVGINKRQTYANHASLPPQGWQSYAIYEANQVLHNQRKAGPCATDDARNVQSPMRVTLGARKDSVKPFWQLVGLERKMQQMFRSESGLSVGFRKQGRN